MKENNDFYRFPTIAAIATAFGNAGVGIIRISGDKSFEIINKIFSKKVEKKNHIYYGLIKNNDIILDEVIVLPFKSPNSYTGEDVIEIQSHGGLKVLQSILDLVLNSGAILAKRGEFTKRAFLNKKLDLSQAQSVLDLIEAKTSNFAQKSVINLKGKLSLEINQIKQILLEVLGRIVAAIDFPEDVEEPEYDHIKIQLLAIINRIDKILNGATNSNIMRDGLKIALAGRPNVGKSSLFNLLLNNNRAIVTDIAGTTRDSIDSVLKYHNKEYILVDTAGMRKKGKVFESIEKYSLFRSLKSIDNSDICLVVINAEEGITEHDKHIAGYAIEKGKGLIFVVNKWDTVKDTTIQEFEKLMRAEFQFATYAPIVYLSALTKKRIHTLMPEVIKVAENIKKEIKTSLINEVILDAYQLNIPPSYKGKRLKIYFTSQTGTKPPKFTFRVNSKGLVHFSYERYLENKIRENFDFTGTPIVLQFKNRNDEN